MGRFDLLGRVNLPITPRHLQLGDGSVEAVNSLGSITPFVRISVTRDVGWGDQAGLLSLGTYSLFGEQQDHGFPQQRSRVNHRSQNPTLVWI